MCKPPVPCACVGAQFVDYFLYCESFDWTNSGVYSKFYKDIRILECTHMRQTATHSSCKRMHWGCLEKSILWMVWIDCIAYSTNRRDWSERSKMQMEILIELKWEHFATTAKDVQPSIISFWVHTVVEFMLQPTSFPKNINAKRNASARWSADG